MESAINRLVENTVERARRNGDLDDLPGAGRPIEKSSLTTDPLAHVYLESGAIHPVAALKARIVEARAELDKTTDPETRRALQTRIAQLETQSAVEAETFRRYG
ncbi:MAG: DnaJ family domain-containing protein [Pelagibaca sp.]